MSDHDTITPETDDEIRARLQAFAQEVKDRTDMEAAMGHAPRRWRPSPTQLVAIAAGFILAVVIAAAVIADRQSVDTVPPAEAPTGPTTLARGRVQFEGSPFPAGSSCGDTAFGDENSNCLLGQTLDIDASQEDGVVTGQARFSVEGESVGLTVELECVDLTTPAGVVALAGHVTQSPGGTAPAVGSVLAVIVQEGSPDSAFVWLAQGGTCRALFDSMPRPWSAFLQDFIPVIYGFDIETGAPDCPATTQPRAITSGGQMKHRFAAPVARAATALVLLGACSDDGPLTLAKGEDVGFVGGAPGLSDQTMDIDAELDDGKVTGQARFPRHGLTVDLRCYVAGDDGLMIIGGTTSEESSADNRAGEWVAVVILDGDPDRAVVWFEGDDDVGSCREAINAVPEDHRTYDSDIHAEVIGDIETG